MDYGYRSDYELDQIVTMSCKSRGKIVRLPDNDNILEVVCVHHGAGTHFTENGVYLWRKENCKLVG